MRRKRKWERLLAAILTVALIFGSLPTSALAAGSGLTVGYVSENEETDEQTETETSSGVETEAETEADSESETDTETEVDSELETDTETEADSELETGTETEAESETVTEAESEEETGIELVTEAGSELETDAETEAESESETGTESETENMTEETDSEFILEDQGISEAAVFEVSTEDGKVVKLSAPEGAFTVPASEVTMTAEPLTEEQKAALEEQLAALAEEDGMKVAGYVAYDINLWVNDEIVQPLLPVQVTFENIAVAETVEKEEDVPDDMSQVETAGFQMDTDTKEITDVNDTNVADDATPINASVAVEVAHFTLTGMYMLQVDEASPKNYNFTMKQIGGEPEENIVVVEDEEDAATEDGEESEEMVTFEVTVESLKGIGEKKLTLVPSVVEGTEEAGESETAEGEVTEGEAQGEPVPVTFQSNGENLKNNKIKNPEALEENESWTQTIQIPVSELEGVANPMLNLSLKNGKNNINTINMPFSTMVNDTQTIKTSGPITVNGTHKGAYVIDDCTVTFSGGGTIDASGQNRSAIRIINGGKVILDGVTVTGGTGTVIKGSGLEGRGDGTCSVGGGVYVENGSLELKNGTIENNTAQRGGGIFVGQKGTFTMEGGTVSDNQTIDGSRQYFAGEGGGIFVWGTATISGGQIINNTCNSTTDLGGGGLYINNGGIATLINARVTGNTADGFGGGIAGCCHGEISIVALDGVALYGNTAHGTTHTMWYGGKSEATAEIIDHYNAATSEGITGKRSKDFYNSGSTIVSNYMVGGGSANYTVTAGKDGKQIEKDRKIKDNEVIGYTRTDVALVADPSDESKSKVPINGVLISGNKSTVHGGGIGCNGGLYFGLDENTKINFAVLDVTIPAKKQLNGEPAKDPFKFELLDKDKNVIATEENNAEGNVTFTLDGYMSDLITGFDPSKEKNKTVPYTFYLREKDPSDGKTVYDQSLYKIDVTLERNFVKSETVTLTHTTTGNTFKNIEVTYTQYKYTIKKDTQIITKIIKDENGNDISSGVTSITFNNWTGVIISLTKTGYKGKTLAGAEFKVYSDEGCTDLVGEMTTDTNGNASCELVIGKYSAVWVKETKAPEGYLLNGTAYKVSLKDAGKYKTGEVKVEDGSLIPNTPTKVEVVKTFKSPDGTKDLDWPKGTSVTFQIKDKAGNIVSFTNKEGKEVNSFTLSKEHKSEEIYELPTGIYWIHEVEAPEGFELANDVEFEITDNSTEDVGIISKEVTDKQTKVDISKVAAGALAGQNSLTGAVLKIYKGMETTGEPVWISDSSNSSWTVTGLEINSPYTLHEETAPAGYTKAPDIVFEITNEIDGDGKSIVKIIDVNSKTEITSIVMKDTLKESRFAKVDESGNLIPGAKLQIQQDGKVVDLKDIQGQNAGIKVGVELPDGTYSTKLEWVSTDDYVTVYGLPAGNYELVEAGAPTGYVKNTNNKSFTVDQDKDNEAEIKAKIVTIADEKTKAQIVKIFKPDETTFGGKQGFTLGEGQTVEFELYLNGKDSYEIDPTNVVPDPERPEGSATVTYRYGIDPETPVTKLRTQVSLTEGKNTIELIGLPAGTYEVKEISAPAGFILQTDELVVNGETETDPEGTLIQSKAEITNVATEIRIGKKGILSDSDAEEEKGDYIAGAKLQILEKSSGKVASNVYGESLEWTTTDEPVTINGLAPGKKYILHEAETPKDENGNRTWILAEDIEFTVEIDADGKTTISPHEGKETNLLVMRDYQTKVEIEKYSFVNGIDEKKGVIPQGGAELAVYEGRYDKTTDFKNMEAVKTWTSDGSPWVIKGLELDTVYTLAELSAPTGYTLADPIVFKIEDKHNKTRNRDSDDGGEVYILASQNESGMEKQFLAESWVRAEVDGTKDKIRMVNSLYEMRFTKVTEDGNHMDTVTLAITTDSEGKNVVTLKNAHYPNGDKPEAGEPNGYLLFNVQANNGSYYPVYGLEPGDYYLVEESSPLGFVKAKPMKFTVAANQKATEPVVIKTLTNYETRIRIEKKLERFNEYVPKAGDRFVFKLTPVEIKDNMNPGVTVEERMKEALGEDCQIVIDPNTAEKSGEGYLSDEIYGLPAGKYRLYEVEVPNGYEMLREGEDEKEITIDFEVTYSGDENVTVVPVQTIGVNNATTKIAFAKVDENGNPLSGANLRVIDLKDGSIATTIFYESELRTPNEILKWYSGRTAKVFTGLPQGHYLLEENYAPRGRVYADSIEFWVDDTGRVTTKGGSTYTKVDGTQVVTLTMVDDRTEVRVAKEFENGYKMKAGESVVLKIRPVSGPGDTREITLTESNWNGTEKKYISGIIYGLAAGDYFLEEVSAPEGFTIAERKQFTISDKRVDGEIVAEMPVISNTAAEIEISKQSVTTAEAELPGARLQVLDKDGNVVETAYGEKLDWVSGTTSKVIKGLKPGTYTLHEEAAPTGYAYSADIEFTIPENMKSTDELEKVVMEDKVLDLHVTKVDVATDEELAGAKLTLLKKNADDTEEEIESWTSNGEDSHDFGPLLEANGDYILREEAAPQGYAFTADQEFHVEEDGTITTDMRTAEDEDGNTVYLVDDTAIEMHVTKVDVETDEEIAGAKLTLLKKNADDTEEEIESWTSNGEDSHDFGPLLEANGDYILREEAAPQGYAFTADQEFHVEEDGTITTDDMRTAEDEDGNTVYLVDDQALRMPVKKVDVSKDEELAGAKLTVLKKNADGTETVVDSWTSDGETSHDFGPVLEAGGDYILREEAAPRGYDFVADQEFHVNEDGTITTGMKTAEDEDGNTIYLVDDTAIVMYVTKVDATTDAELAGATLTVLKKNADGTETVVDRWTSDGVTPHNFGPMLDADMDYILREEAAPQGYAFTSDQEFHVNKDGTITASMRTTTDEDGNTVYLMDDTAIEMHVTKVDVETGAELAGATLTVLRRNADGTETVVDRWVSDGVTSHDFGPLLEANADYILREEAAPQGYGFVADQEFHVNNDGTITTSMRTAVDEDGNTVYLVEDRAIELHVTKVDVETEEELAGATLTVLRRNADGTETVVDRWVSDGVTSHDFGPLLEANADYILREEAAPQGYGFVADQELHVNNDGTITTSMRTAVDEDGNTVYLVEDRAIELHVTKVDVETDEELAGATLTVLRRNADGTETVVDRWVSDGVTSHDFGPLLEANGDYILREEAAPDGYAFTSDQEFHVNNDGTITTSMRTTVDADGNTVYLVDDRALHMVVNKVDVSSQEELAGAELTLYLMEGDELTEVDRWTSVIGETHDFGPALKAGGTYLLRETAAPDGYKYTSDITFEVAQDGTIRTTMNRTTDENGNTIYLVEDEATRAEIEKIDAETREPLAGAHLQITDENGTVVEEWISDGTPHIVEAKLSIGKTYTLTETEAPEFYELAEPVTFTVAQDGTIPNIVMEDTRVTGARIAVTKTLTYNGDPVNAVDETFYVALFEDEERTRRVSDVKAVEFRNASSSTVEFDDLEPGKTYYIGETDEDGVLLEAGTLGDGTVYEAHFNEGYEAVVEQEDGTVQVRFENELLDVPGPEYYLDAELSVTKKLVGADGLPMKSSDTFYAGIFEDAEHTKLSDKVSQNIVPLALGGDSTVTETVSVSLMPDEELKLYVTEVTEDGTPVRTGSEFEYDFLVEDGEVTLNEEHTSAATTITNSPALPVHPYNVGELTITKRLLGADGYEMASTEVFYAGIFDDAEHTQLSERVSENIVQLALNGNSRATATVEVSMASDETATLYVTEVYEDGTPVEKSASFQYEVSVEGAVLEMTNNTAGETTITNREKGGEQETEGGNDETEKPDENGNGGGNNSGGGGDNYVPQSSVKTGDETPVWLYLGIFLAAAAVLAVLFFERRRRVRK